MKQESFDDIIRRKADSYQAPVPAEAWENIMQGKKKKRRVILFWWWLVLLLIGGGSVLLFNNNTGGKNITENNNTLPENNSQQSTVKENQVVKKRPAIINPKDSSHILTNETIETTIKISPKAIATINLISNQPSKEKLANSKKEKQRQPAGNLLAGNTVFSTSIHKEEIIQPGKITGKQKKNTPDEESIFQTGTPIDFMNELPDHASSFETAPYQAEKISTESAPGDHIETTTIIAPGTITIKSKLSPWKIDMGITPFLSFQQHNNLPALRRETNTPGYITEFIADEIHTTVKPGISFSIALSKKINKKIVMGAGLQYSVIKEKVLLSGAESITNYSIIKRLVKDSNGDYLIDDTAWSISSGKRKIEALNSYTTYSVPLFLQTSLTTNRVYSLQFSTGIFLNLFRHYKNSIEGNFSSISNPATKPAATKTTMGVDLFAGLRLETIPRKKWGVFAEPVLRYSLLKNKDTRIINSKNIHQAGISFGVNYRL